MEVATPGLAAAATGGGEEARGLRRECPGLSIWEAARDLKPRSDPVLLRFAPTPFLLSAQVHPSFLQQSPWNISPLL